MARCDYCRKTLPVGGKMISSLDGLVFDSTRCRKRYADRALVRGMANVMRVARSRLKARIIQRAHAVYHKIGGRDWPKVKLLLGAAL